jgi:uncharacterized protein
MTLIFTAGLAIAMVGTAFLSGIFGMAGGMILIGVLLALLPVPAAMTLHAVTQMASNGWRALLWRKHISWRAAGIYGLGSAIAVVAWSMVLYVPAKPIAFLMLGLTPLAVRLVPLKWRPDPESILSGAYYSCGCMTLMLLTGVSGPLLDMCFIGGRFDRRQIVATKAACQVAGHGLKFVYFGALIHQAAELDPVLAFVAVAASMLGTSLARRVLESMSDRQFRLWTNRLITAVAGFYLARGGYLLLLG